jgi:predicted ester cyclase
MVNTLLIRNRKALITQLHDCLNRYDFATAATMVASKHSGDYVNHWQDIRRTFPDFKVEALDIIIENKWIVVNALFSGTHRGVAKLPHNGSLLVNAKATGRTVTVPQMYVYQIVASKLLEFYALRDDESLYQQLRLLPQLKSERLEAAHGHEDVPLVTR